jgi:hypothetical protein
LPNPLTPITPTTPDYIISSSLQINWYNVGECGFCERDHYDDLIIPSGCISYQYAWISYPQQGEVSMTASYLDCNSNPITQSFYVSSSQVSSYDTLRFGIGASTKPVITNIVTSATVFNQQRFIDSSNTIGTPSNPYNLYLYANDGGSGLKYSSSYGAGGSNLGFGGAYIQNSQFNPSSASCDSGSRVSVLGRVNNAYGLNSGANTVSISLLSGSSESNSNKQILEYIQLNNGQNYWTPTTNQLLNNSANAWFDINFMVTCSIYTP